MVLDSGGYLFNFVAGRWELEKFPAETSQLVFIGHGLMAGRGDIVNGLQQCERQDELYTSLTTTLRPISVSPPPASPEEMIMAAAAATMNVMVDDPQDIAGW